jgi:hypothetical protein
MNNISRFGCIVPFTLCYLILRQTHTFPVSFSSYFYDDIDEHEILLIDTTHLSD